MALTVRRWVAVLVSIAVMVGGDVVLKDCDPNPWGQTVRRR